MWWVSGSGWFVGFWFLSCVAALECFGLQQCWLVLGWYVGWFGVDSGTWGGLVFWGAFPLFLRFGVVVLRLVLLWGGFGCVDWFSWRFPFSVGLV